MRVVDKRGFLCSLILLAFISLLFLSQSRLPALDEKAQMGQRNHLSSLAFDVIYPLSAEQGHAERILYSSLNWAYTNWQGMTFGFLFAAAVLTLISFLSINLPKVADGRNPYKQAFIGALLGTPLGVCANCSTPIAFGLYRGGLPTPTALSMLSSSPSFNFIVVAMSLSLLPIELVAIKYILIVFFVLLVIPFLSARFHGEGGKFKGSGIDLPLNACAITQQTRGLQFVFEFTKAYLGHLGFILKGALPLMLLAGGLAALVAEFVSLDNLNGSWTLIILIVVALCAAFFPVPIAFDVVISVGLLAAGVDIAYVGAAFFALGVFSIYPATMVARDISLKLSLALLLSVSVLALLAGLTVSAYTEQSQGAKLLSVTEKLSQLAMTNDAAEKEAIELHGLPEYSARPLMRKAARACHVLGESRQYDCFERFVVELLSKQFSASACDYLEDAASYRQRCMEAFDYLKVRKGALTNESVDQCNSLPTQYRQRCRYDYFFEKTLEQQSLSPCLSLNSQEGQRQCLVESLALNTELYPGYALCASLEGSGAVEDLTAFCLNEHKLIRQNILLVQQGDLNACSGLESSVAVQRCQALLINHKLEQGADKSFCTQLNEPVIKAACDDFSRYFQGINVGDSEACSLISNTALKARCNEEAIQAYLAELLSDLSYQYLNEQHDQLAGALHSEGEEVEALLAKTKGLDLVDTHHLKSELGRDFVLKSYALKGQNSDDSVVGFEQTKAASIGLESAPAMKAVELFEPFSYGRGIATGDTNQDLWPDLAIAYSDRIRLYQNMGGRFAKRKTLEFGSELSPVLVSFVDLDADSYPDLFVSFYGAGNRIYWNQGGSFDQGRYQELMLENSQLVMSAAFQDVDQDGDIDMALGSWFAGDLRHFNPHRSQNYYIENAAIKKHSSNNTRRDFKPHALPGAQGETLSVLFSDIDRDGKPELLVGNDMDAPDIIYRWKSGRFQVAKADSNLPAYSAFNTMSIASGDLNRDQLIDYFSVDMSFGQEGGLDYCQQAGIADLQACRALLSLDQAVKSGQVGTCQYLAESKRKQDCLQAQLIQLARQSRQDDICSLMTQENKVAESLCRAASKVIPPKQAINYSLYPKGVQRNVLSMSSMGGWQELAEDWAVSESYWSWHSKIADLNNDGWNDIYVGNGYMFGGAGRRTQTNVLYMNKHGEGMYRAEAEMGLEDYLNTPSFVTVDFDRDGDLDIISQRVAADHGVFINQTREPGILIDLRLNGQTVLGSSVQLLGHSLDDESAAQLSQQVLGGGFLSFDEPLAHFGMAEKQSYQQLQIKWLSGSREKLDFLFLPARYYLIEFDK